MSEMAQDTESKEDGAMGVEARAADWLIRQRDLDGWSEDDRQVFEAWLTESFAHRVAYTRLQAAWTYSDRLAALSRSQSRPRRPDRISSTVIRIGVLSTIVAIIAADFFAFFPFRQNETTYATLVGGYQVVQLADTSRVELNTDTVLRTAVNADHRTAWLDRGEAFFRIKHDPAHPFVVMAGNRRITDLGTEFTIRRDGDLVKVALLSGRAFVDRADGANGSSSALLLPGDIAIATPNKFSITRNPESALINALGWRTGVVIFDHTALIDAASEFNRYNAHKLVITDPKVARIAIGGTFDMKNVRAFADIAKHAIGLHVEDRGDETAISR